MNPDNNGINGVTIGASPTGALPLKGNIIEIRLNGTTFTSEKI